MINEYSEILYDICSDGDIQSLKEIVSSKKVNINEMYLTGLTPLIHLIICNHTEMVMYFLKQPELRIDLIDIDGETAFHWACSHNMRIAILRLLCEDKRCTPTVLNIKNENGWTALMVAVNNGQLEIVKELDKMEGIDFDTKNNDGKTLIEMARMNPTNPPSILKGKSAVLEYLWNRKKNTLKGIAANIVGKHLANKEAIDVLVDDLHIPKSLKTLVADFIDN